MSDANSLYHNAVDSMTPFEKVARSIGLFNWSREFIGRQIQEANPESSSERIKLLTKSRRLIGPDMHLVCGIAPPIKATPELVKRGIKVALDHPANVNGLAFKHYDGASFGLMRAFKQGMIEAGVQGLTPIMGKEVEDMKLENFKRFDDYVEEWGAQTTGQGIASFDFDLPSGTYDVRISYFDEEKGHSQVRLFAGDDQVIDFKLDGDTDCWTWRRFEKIGLKQGDNIRLVVDAAEPETVRLDYVEFIEQ